MSKEETNIITMKMKYHTETKEDSDRIFQTMVNYNNVVKCTYNYLLKHPKASTSEISHYQNSLNNIFLDTHFKGSAIYEAKGLINRIGENKLIFGGKNSSFKDVKIKSPKKNFINKNRFLFIELDNPTRKEIVNLK